MKKCYGVLAILALMAVSQCAFAQSIFSDIDNAKKVSDQIKTFSDKIKDLSKAASRMSSTTGIDGIMKELDASDFKFEMFFQANSEAISVKDDLQAKVLDYRTARKTLGDSLTVWRARIDARDQFEAADAFLASQDSTYKAMYRSSNKLSIAPQTAKALEKLKAREQLKFAEVQSYYDKACAAMQADPSLAGGFESIEENYIELKSFSVKIQQAAYKPFIDRIKDYLMSIAAVTIVLMFLVMIKGQITSAKQYRENMKKMKEQFKKNDDEIPSI